jgi:peptidoglycan/xylan/chitin deacetylase (PgdA/CDA1 family)
VITPLAPASAAVSCTNGCVIFRFDDIQDYYLSGPQTAVMDKFITNNQNVTLGVIMNFIGNDQTIIDKVNSGRNHPFEIAIHGWNHDDYSTLSALEQKNTLQQAKSKMATLFGVNSTTFILPYNTYNTDTLQAMQDLGMKIVSSEFDQEDVIVTDHIFNYTKGNDLKDSFGIYHLPQKIEYYNVTVPVDGNGNPLAKPTKTSLSNIMGNVTAAINNYGYAVITMHPTDFSEFSGVTPTGVVNATEIADLDTLITNIGNAGYTITSFNGVTNTPLLPLVDNTPPTLKLPLDVFFVSSTTTNPGQINFGVATATDVVDPSPVVTNNATAWETGGFPVGHNPIKWTATDNKGNSVSAIQYVTIWPTADNFNPAITISAPLASKPYNMPPGGVNIRVNGTAVDNESGVKYVNQTETDRQSYSPNSNFSPLFATPKKAPYDWSTWNVTLHVTDPSTTQISANAWDFANRVGNLATLGTVTITSVPSDTVKPEIRAPANIIANATGPTTPVTLGTPYVFDNSDLSPVISNNIGPGESTGFHVGVTPITWKATDASGNFITAIQTVTISNVTPQITDVTPPSSSSIGLGFLANYTLSEVVGKGNVTFTGIAGPDNGVTHFYNFTDDNKLLGSHSISKNTLETSSDPSPGPFGTLVHGSVYNMKIAVADAVTGITNSVTNTSLTFDNVIPVISAVTPTGSSIFYEDFSASYTLSETVKSGTITFTGIGGTPDAAAHIYNFVPADLNAGSHSISRTTLEAGFGNSLVVGAVYTMTVSATDPASNNAVPILNTLLTYNNHIPVISAVTPASSSSVVGAFPVRYTLSETIGSGTITFTKTAGTDSDSPHVYTLAPADMTSGSHTISRTTLEAYPGFGGLDIDATYTMVISVNDAITATNVQSTSTLIKLYSTTPNDVSCPALAVPWTITSNCTISTTISPLGDVIIQNGAVVYIKSGGVLNIDTATKHLTVKSGSILLIKPGGKLS